MPCVVEARCKELEISSGFSIAQHLPVFSYEEGTEMVSFLTLRWDMIEKLSSVYMKAVLIQLYNPDSSMLYVICMLGCKKTKLVSL